MTPKSLPPECELSSFFLEILITAELKYTNMDVRFRAD